MSEEENYIEVAYRETMHRLYALLFEQAMDPSSNFEDILRRFNIGKARAEEIKKRANAMVREK